MSYAIQTYKAIMRIGGASRRRTARSAPRRKNLILDQRLIDRARRLLGAPTETETITRALAAVVDLGAFRRDLASAARALYGKGQFSHVEDDRGLDFSGFIAPAARPASRQR